MLVLLRGGEAATIPAATVPAPAAEPRVVLTFERPSRAVVLERRGGGATWRVDTDGSNWTTTASRAGSVDVVRLPDGMPAARWSASVNGARTPTEGSAAVAELARPRDGLAKRPARWQAEAGLVAVLTVALVALHGRYSAGRRALHGALRSIGFGVLTVFCMPLLVAQLRARVPDSPDLLTAAAVLAPLLAFAVAAGVARLATARVPTAGEAPAGLRLLTGLTAVALVAFLGYAGELASVRFFPGLTW